MVSCVREEPNSHVHKKHIVVTLTALFPITPADLPGVFVFLVTQFNLILSSLWGTCDSWPPTHTGNNVFSYYKENTKELWWGGLLVRSRTGSSTKGIPEANRTLKIWKIPAWSTGGSHMPFSGFGRWAGCPKDLGLDMLAQWGGWPHIWICWNGQAPDKVSALEDVLVHGAPFLTHSFPESILRLTANSNLGNHS